VEDKKSTISNLILYFGILLIGGLSGALLLYFLESTNTTTFFKQESASKTENEDSTQELDKDETNPSTTTNPFTGTYISGVLPTNWEIVEYTDNTGSDMIMEQTAYSGLVGLKIFNENNIEMFHLKAVDGIGGTAGCDTVYEFSDSDQAYINHGNDWTLEVGTIPSTVVDLTNSTYSEYEILGWEVRRVESELYRNMNSNLPGFNPACGIDVNLTIQNLAYNRVISGGLTQGNTYYIGISDTVESSQLEQLDDVLESLSVN